MHLAFVSAQGISSSLTGRFFLILHTISAPRALILAGISIPLLFQLSSYSRSSAMSNTPPRCPGMAQSLSLGPRMPFEAAEALLWERQNNRVQSHLSLQVKELQTQHDTFSTRIQATEAVSEAAEATIRNIKQMELKIAAIEAEERDRPFDKWVKEAIGHLQISVEGMKGFRQKLNGLEVAVEKIDECIDSTRNDSTVLKNMVRKVEMLEEGSRDEARKVTLLEEELARLKTAHRQPANVIDHEQAESYVEVQTNDSPLKVFYGIDTQPHTGGQQSPAQYQKSPARRDGLENSTFLPNHQENREESSFESPHQHLSPVGDLQPPGEDHLPCKHDDFDALETRSTSNLFENTQQYKAMHEELLALRAMCQTQEHKYSNDTADATQRPDQQIINTREKNVGFSDATTEPETDYNTVKQYRRRTETQSARRNLMKRPSINSPRVPLGTRDGSPNRPTPGNSSELDQIIRDLCPSSPPVLPVNKPSAKRKRIDDSPMQRVTRPRLANDAVDDKGKTALTAKKVKKDLKEATTKVDLISVDTCATVSVSPIRQTYGKQKSYSDRPVQHLNPQASSTRREHKLLPIVRPTLPVAGVVKSPKAVGKAKPNVKAKGQAAPGSSKTANVKKESTSTGRGWGSCLSCRSRHQMCDRTRPACGRCAKFSTVCEYPAAKQTFSRKKVQMTATSNTTADQSDSKRDVRERSMTAAPEMSRQEVITKRPKGGPPSKKSTFGNAPTAASFRQPRAKNTQK